MPIDSKQGFDPQRLRRISNWMEAHVREGRLSGLAVQIARRGEIAFSERRGYADTAT
ncbi:MAG TPA: serine hydrolase, partial [Ruegeria sp.]|nr:serine hydrolase [Ruegeria sp.]